MPHPRQTRAAAALETVAPAKPRTDDPTSDTDTHSAFDPPGPFLVSIPKAGADERYGINVAGLRHLVFNEGTNGLRDYGAIVRIGRKVLIHHENFMTWAREHGGNR